MRHLALGWGLLAVLMLAGCGKDVRADLSNIINRAEAPKATMSYRLYVDAAENMEREGAKYIGRTSWSPDQRDAIIDAAAGSIRLIQGGVAGFGQTWSEPFGIRTHTRGWRTIGRALQWRIERSVKTGNHADAVYCMAAAAQMANALATSDSHDAEIGLEIASSCAEAIWPSLTKLGAGELNSLSERLMNILSAAPSPERTVAQERAIISAQEFWLLEQYQARDFAAISKTLGEAVTPAVKYLRELAKSPADKQKNYFKGFWNEMEEDLAAFQTRLESAPYLWKDAPKKGARPWMRFVHAFGTPWKKYVERRAQVRTSLRLLAIDAGLLGGYKASGRVPSSLSSFPKAMRTDPYSGRDLVYVSRGVDYKLYSVGPNQTDDGGDEGDLGLGR